MKPVKYAVSIFLVLFVFSFFPVVSADPVWEQCNSGISCASRVADSTTYLCHRDSYTGNWQWNSEGYTIGSVESDAADKSSWTDQTLICADNADNNCDGDKDSPSATNPTSYESNDCVAPSTYPKSVASDISSPYRDTVNDAKTDVVISGETEMTCRWYASASDYTTGSGTACTTSGTDATCSITDATTQGSWTRYTACADSYKNGQFAADPGSLRRPDTVTWINDWTAPAVTFNSPLNTVGLPYTISIDLSDAHSGVDKSSVKVEMSNGGSAWVDKTSWFTPVSGTCDTVAGDKCTLTYTVDAGIAEAANGEHGIRVTAKDNAGNALSPLPTHTYSVSTCTLDSVSIAPSALCAKSINQCTSAGTACGAGNGITVTAKYSGLNCPTIFTVQVDAKTSDSLCNVQGSGGQMTGISISCSNPTPVATQRTCTGTWSLPNPVPSACQQKTITSSYACIDGTYCTTPSGSFGSCKDTSVPAVSISLDKEYAKSSDTITATLSGIDNTYGLRLCKLDWGDTIITSKTCDAGAGVNCNNKFTSSNTHTYPSDGSKTAVFSCENLNGNPGVTGSSSDSVTICSSIAGVSGMSIYDSSSKAKTLLQSTWQNDNTPYFEWTPVTSSCGVIYEVQIDSGAPFDVTANYYSPAALANGQHQIKFTSKDNAGNRGTTQTVNLWSDINAPATSITETVPAWFTTNPTLHFTCSDSPAGCGATYYCAGTGCAPSIVYNPSAGVPLTATATLNFRSIDLAGNVENTITKLVQIDTSKPSTPAVADSGQWTKLTDQLSATWTSSADTESGIAEYQISIGTTAGGTDVKPYTGMGLSLSTTLTGLNLLNDVKYYINVRAKNNAGLFSDPGSSDGITVRTEGPVGTNNIYVERMFGNYISGSYKIFTGALADPTGISSCSYTIDGRTWRSATYDSLNTVCKTSTLTCKDGDTRTMKMRALNALGTISETATSLVRICDAIAPELISFNPPAGSSLHTSSGNPVFTLNARDMKSGVAKIEWVLYLNGVPVPNGILTKDCDGGVDGVAVACTVAVNEVTSLSLKNGDVLYVKAKADDHVDPWSGYGDSGQWVIDENAPEISTITPTVATLGALQSYSAVVKSQPGKMISSCDLLANGVTADSMGLTSGTTVDGTWTGKYVIVAPSIVFMRAHCTDDVGNQGDGVDILVSLATSTVSGVNIPRDQPPSFPAPTVTVEKADMTNITARYSATGVGVINDAKCWISSSTFNDPSRGIVGAVFRNLDNGYYTHSFEAPVISGSYDYTVSCYKNGYQTTSDSGSFNVLGCDGEKCIKLTPVSTLAILALGETQPFDLVLQNRDDFARTYSVSLVNPDPRVSVDISPTQIALLNGEEKKISLKLTSLEISDQQITQNILVQNIAPEKSGDSAVSAVNVSIAIGSVPAIGVAGIVLLLFVSSVLVYRRIL